MCITAPKILEIGIIMDSSISASSTTRCLHAFPKKPTPAAALTSIQLSSVQSTVQVSVNINMIILSTSRRSVRPLQFRTIHPFEDPVPLSSYLNTHLSLRELFQVMRNFARLLGCLRSTNRSQTSVEGFCKQFKALVVVCERGQQMAAKGCTSIPQVPSSAQIQTFAQSVRLSRRLPLPVAQSALHCLRHNGIQRRGFQCPCRWLPALNQWL